MEMTIDLPGGDRVDASFRGLTLSTDQNGSAPTPFELFLASIGTCAGIYVARFCEQRGIPSDGVRIDQRIEFNPLTHQADRIDLEIRLPRDFPEQHREAVVRSAELCAVKRHLERPPTITVRWRTALPAGPAGEPSTPRR